MSEFNLINLKFLINFMSMVSDENFYDDEGDTGEIFEADFLNPDEIAMIYDEKRDVIVSPLYLSLSHFTKSLKLKRVLKIKSNNSMYLDFYKDENNNIIVIKYKILPILFRVTHNDKEETQITLKSLYIEPTAWASSVYDSRPTKIDLRKLVQNYKRNAIKKVAEELSKVVTIYTSIKKIKPNYVV